MDDDIAVWAAQLDAAQLSGTLTWFSGVAQREMSRPRWLCVTQMFNHQTHHRGQVTTLLKQARIDPGPTDLPWVLLPRDEQKPATWVISSGLQRFLPAWLVPGGLEA